GFEPVGDYPNEIKLAYDAADNTIWYSSDAGVRIYHYHTYASARGSAVLVDGTPYFDVNVPPNDMTTECGYSQSSGVTGAGAHLHAPADSDAHAKLDAHANSDAHAKLDAHANSDAAMFHAHAHAYANSHAHANSDAAQRLASYAPHRAAVSASDGPDAQTQAGLHLISRATSPTSHRGGGPWAPFDGEDPAQAPPGSLHLAQRHPRLLPTGSVRGGPDPRLCGIVVGRPRRHAPHKPRRPRIHERRLRRCNTPSVGERRRLQRRVACVQHTVDRRADIPCLRPLRRSGGPTRSRARRLVQRPRAG